MHLPSLPSACRLATALLATSVISLSAGAASYTLVDLGLRKFPVAVNDHGDVAANGPDSRALVRRHGHWHLLADRTARASAINAHGDVAGGNGALPMLWRPGQDGMELGLPGGAGFGLGLAINDARAVVGLFEADDATIHCFQWTSEGGPIDIGFMGAGNFCQAFAVNNGGQITGEASIHPDPDRLEHAFVYDGKFHDLGILANGDRSQGIAINDHGDVAGRASVPPLDDMHFHAVKWPEGGGIVDLDPQDRFVNSVATAINDAGEVVGTVTIDAAGRQKAVRFDGHRAVRLETEVQNLYGWTLDQAEGLNAHGEIVGVGTAPDGREHAFLLRPQ